jgi:excisionase family DNA binding protein
MSSMRKKKDGGHSPTTQQPSPIMPRLLTIPQAAVYCSCTVWAVRQLCWSKELRSIRIGNKIQIDRADLDALIDRRLRDAR